MFNYRALIRQVPPRTWQIYFQANTVALPPEYDWETPPEQLTAGIIAAIEALPSGLADRIHAQLLRVHNMANRHGIDALRNAAAPDAALHDDFLQLSSDADRALWVMANWPDLFDTAESILATNLRLGKRGWKRLQVAPGSVLFRAQHDLRALEAALADVFTPRKGHPRACEIEALDRHLDGGLQLSILIEDNAQRQLEFGDDNHTFWRSVRPPLPMGVVIYPESGVIDLLVSGGWATQRKVLERLGSHIFKEALSPQAVKQPVFFLNRLRDGLALFDDNLVDLAAHRVESIRLSQVKLRSTQAPHCDYTIKPPAKKEAPDVLACLKAHRIDQQLLHHGFNIMEAVVSLHFLPSALGKPGRVLHIELKQTGISNLRDLDQADALLAEALLRAWGVMQPPVPTITDRQPALA